MKLLVFLPFALGTRIPIFSDEFSDNHFDFDDQSENELFRHPRAYTCDRKKIQSFLNDRMKQCKRFNIKHAECATWTTKELQRECGGSYNCVVTDYSNEIAAWGQYFGKGSLKKNA